MSKKFLFVIFIFASLMGGFFLFKNIDKNLILASLLKSDKVVVLSENDFIALEEKFNFLDRSLSEISSRFENLDDLIEETDILKGRVDSLDEKFQTVNLLVGTLQKKEEEESSENTIKKEKELSENFCEAEEGKVALRKKIIINEVAWMGTLNSSDQEWIELKNISDERVDLKDWQLQDKNRDIKIIFKEGDSIEPGGFYLLKRNKDDFLTVKADKIYKGTLSNQNEALYLFYPNCDLEDEVKASPDWPAGENSSKRTMERKNDLSWQTSSEVEGTPKAENSKGYSEQVIISKGGGGSSPKITISYPKILISEVRISPLGERFIELYNPNDRDLDLTGWYIQRKTKGATSWASFISSSYFEGKKILAYSHFLIAAKQELNPDILLNSLTLTQDNTIVLKNPNQEEVDKLGWGEASDFERNPAPSLEEEKSLGRKLQSDSLVYQDTDDNSNDFELQEPTPRFQNKSPSSLPPEPPEPLPEEPQNDNVAPEIIFNLEKIQTSLKFNLEFSVVDKAPQSLEGCGIKSVLLQLKNQDNKWEDFFQEELEGCPLSFNFEKEFEGVDGEIYYFRVKAKDCLENESDWLEVFTQVKLPKNFLENWNFEEWENEELKGWKWTGAKDNIQKFEDSLAEDYSVALTSTSTNRGLYQYGKEMSNEITYYASVWVKGEGIISLGIKYPASDTIYYSEEIILNSDQWLKITHSRKPANSGNDGGLRINVKCDESKGVLCGKKVMIGAAWLSDIEPPSTWP